MKKSVYRQRYTQQALDLDIVIFSRHIAEIGGIESWLYYVGKKYNVGQITVLYQIGDYNQIQRLLQEIDVVQYVGQEFRCNKIIFCNAQFIIPELYDNAKERYAIIHCDYKYSNFGWEIAELPKMDKIYAVSETASKSFRKIQEQEVFTLYNPVEIDNPKKLLKLISATRLTEEKGLSRIIKLSEELDRHKIPYLWLIFTDRPYEGLSKNIMFMKPRYNMSDYIIEADYGVQLSSTESYCLFIQECLKLKVPVIITDLDVYRELEITENEAHYLKLDMSNLDVYKIYNHIPKVEYKTKDSDDEYKKLLEGDMKKKTFRERYSEIVLRQGNEEKEFIVISDTDIYVGAVEQALLLYLNELGEMA